MMGTTNDHRVRVSANYLTMELCFASYLLPTLHLFYGSSCTLVGSPWTLKLSTLIVVTMVGG